MAAFKGDALRGTVEPPKAHKPDSHIQASNTSCPPIRPHHQPPTYWLTCNSQQQTKFKQLLYPHSVPPVPTSLLTAARCPLLFPSQTASDQPVRCSATTAAQPASISPPASSAVDHLSHPSTVTSLASADPLGPDYQFTPAHQYASSIPVHSASLNCSGSPPSSPPKLLLWPRPHHPLHVVSIGAACSACFCC